MNSVSYTSNKLRRCVSHRLRQPISVLMYQPLNAVPENWMPPQSNIMPDTAGTEYQRSPNSPNHSILEHKTSH